jgi:hypothetical protein
MALTEVINNRFAQIVEKEQREIETDLQIRSDPCDQSFEVGHFDSLAELDELVQKIEALETRSDARYDEVNQVCSTAIGSLNTLSGAVERREAQLEGDRKRKQAKVERLRKKCMDWCTKNIMLAKARTYYVETSQGLVPRLGVARPVIELVGK